MLRALNGDRGGGIPSSLVLGGDEPQSRRLAAMANNWVLCIRWMLMARPHSCLMMSVVPRNTEERSKYGRSERHNDPYIKEGQRLAVKGYLDVERRHWR